MKKIAIAVFGVVCLLILVVVAIRGKGETKASGANTTSVLEKGNLLSQVIETGSLEAKKTVEVKSRVAGRIAKLLVDEGDIVTAGQLVAVIDPEETQLRVSQDQARLRGAQAQLDRLRIEIKQREVTSKTNVQRAKSRVDQLKLELNAQPTLTRTEVDSAETAYNNAVRARDLLIKVTQPNEKTNLTNQLIEARANYESALSEHNRSTNLLAKGFISQRNYDDAKAKLSSSQARLDTIKSQVESLDSEQANKRGQAEESVRQAKAGFERATANTFHDATKKQEYERALADKQDAEAAMLDLQAMQATVVQQEAGIHQINDTLNDSLRELRETELRAPIDGIIASRQVQEGELVASLSSFSSGTSIFKIEDRSSMIVKLQINEIDVAKLTLEMKAEIVVDAFTEKKFSGKITKIAPTNLAGAQGQQQSTNVVKYAVEIEMLGADQVLKSGMSAKCTMTVLDKKDVLTLPRQFVGKGEDGKYFVMIPPSDPKDKKAKPTKVTVEIGDASATTMEIVSGIKLGQKVLKPDYTGPDRKGMMQFGNDDEENSDAEKKPAEKESK